MQVDEEKINADDNVVETDTSSPPSTSHTEQNFQNLSTESNKNGDEIEEIENNSDDARLLKGTALLKSLLSTSIASSASAAEKMITTTEVTDEMLNLKKILYQPEQETVEEKGQEPVSAQNGQNIVTSETHNDDDDRLVIDISDEEKDSESKGNSMPSLSASREYENKILRRISRPTTLDTSLAPFRPMTRHLQRAQQNLLPKSITYDIEPSATSGNNNCVKIDILAPSLNQTEVPSSTDKNLRAVNHHQQASKCSQMSTLTDELNLIGHEIDKQMTKKTNEALELLKELLSGSLEKHNFMTRMTDATDTNLSDLVSIAKKLVKRHKFEVNPNHKEFMRIKHLQFPTTSNDLIIYFNNLLPSLNQEKFLSMIKFYEIIIKEMLNLNKTKIIQYLIDFMIMRKNAQLDLLNYNFQITSSPNLKQPTSTMTKFQLPDSTQNPSERRPIRLIDTSYNFIIRSDPIYLQAGSSFVTNHRDVITCRMSPRIQMRKFERRPFDNNVLKGRRVGRRLVVSSPDGEKIQPDFIRGRFPLTPQSEPGTPIQQIAQIRSTTPIIVESDTPPPSVPSEPSSPPHHKIMKPVILSNTLIKPSRLDQNSVTVNNTSCKSPEAHQNNSDNLTAEPAKRIAIDRNSKDPLQNGQITIHEIQTLNQNGTDIIPTSILKTTATGRTMTSGDEQESSASIADIQAIRKFLPRVLSHEEHIKPSQPMVPRMPKRRQSCHERIMMPATTEASEDKKIENSPIGKKYMEFLHMFENEMRTKKLLESQLQQRSQLQMAQPLHVQQKRVRFSSEADTEIPLNHQQSSVHYPSTQQELENRQRLAQYQASQRSQIRSPIKPNQPQINYQYYQHQFERELRERGFDHHIDSHQEPNRPLELVSHIPPERYHQHEQQRAHFINAAKQVRHLQDKQQPPQQQQHQQRHQPRTLQINIDPQQAVMMAAAYHQLQTLHRDPATLTPQQYAEHLKQLDHLKQFQPSAFSAYQRNHRAMEEQRPPPEYYANTQDIHQQGQRSSPAQYQISSSSSRENSPNDYEMMQQEQSLQRKLKYKAKSSKYIEPNQLTKPFYNPAHSTYYNEPFAMTKNKSSAPTSSLQPPSSSFLPQERQRSRSPNTRTILENAVNSQHYQWLMAQAQSQAQNQPQRPIARPPVPAFIEPNKIPNSSQLHSVFQEQPTPFLRSFYANQKNY